MVGYSTIKAVGIVLLMAAIMGPSIWYFGRWMGMN